MARPLPSDHRPRRAFAWEADTAGTIRWVDLDAREALIGLNVLHDGYWHKPTLSTPLTHISGVRIEVPGHGAAAGGWLLTGEACFGPCGRDFRGYRGEAWRECREEKPAAATNGLAADALRGLVHELRTPLNAIVGFGELIDGQIEGAAASAYRPRTTRIAADAAKLVAAIDELDTAARTAFAEREDAGMMTGNAIVPRLYALSRSCPSRKDVRFNWQDAADIPSIALSSAAFDYLAARLIALCLGYAREGERLVGGVFRDAHGAPSICILAALPEVLRGRMLREGNALVDPEGDWPFAPELGLRFAFHMLSSAAIALGARLDVQEVSLTLQLPAA